MSFLDRVFLAHLLAEFNVHLRFLTLKNFFCDYGLIVISQKVTAGFVRDTVRSLPSYHCPTFYEMNKIVRTFHFDI